MKCKYSLIFYCFRLIIPANICGEQTKELNCVNFSVCSKIKTENELNTTIKWSKKRTEIIAPFNSSYLNLIYLFILHTQTFDLQHKYFFNIKLQRCSVFTIHIQYIKQNVLLPLSFLSCRHITHLSIRPFDFDVYSFFALCFVATQ